MIGNIPSYDDYVRTTKQGGPEGKCQVCGHEGPMDHGLTGYECARCKSMDLALKLKDNKVYYQLRKQVEPAPQ
jgi:hypothetical protein